MWDKVVDIEKCHLQKDPANNIRNSVKKFALDNNLAFFNPREKSGFLRTLMIRNSNQGEFMVLIQFYRENKEQREAILNHLKDKFHLINLYQSSTKSFECYIQVKNSRISFTYAFYRLLIPSLIFLRASAINNSFVIE